MTIRVTHSSQLFTTILDIGAPSDLEASNIESILIENPSKYPHGARGVGEVGAIGAPPAIVSAIEDALAKKIRIKRLLITPETILSSNEIGGHR